MLDFRQKESEIGEKGDLHGKWERDPFTWSKLCFCSLFIASAIFSAFSLSSS